MLHLHFTIGAQSIFFENAADYSSAGYHVVNILLIFSPMSDMSAFNVQPVTPISNRPYD